MCGIICSVATTAVGAVLVVTSCVLSFVVVPLIIENTIKSETILHNDTVQMDRFEEIPFPLNFTVRIFNLTNSEEFLNGAVPVVKEVGPYIYKLYQSREFLSVDGDIIKYRRHENFEFDAEGSFPNTEDDLVTIVNVPYHAIIQIAEASFSNLLPLLNLAMNGIFGKHNSPIATFRVQDLLFGGVEICKNAGVVGGIACSIIRDIGAGTQNLEEQDDGSILFSILAYKQNKPSGIYEVYRGKENTNDLGRIITYENATHFNYWTNETYRDDLVEFTKPGVCNMINGTDSGIFPPFIDTSKQLYAINTDICRSVELRYEKDTEYEGIPTVRYAANEWLLDNDDGCFCLNVTTGINKEDGCLFKGAMELYSCVGAMLVLSYPHFLFADQVYRDGVIGLNPQEEIHKIFIDIEPNTGTPIRGFKRAQFNIFTRRVGGIGATSNLRTTLVPILWVEEGITLPQEYVEELTTRFLDNLKLLDIVLPILIAVCCAVLMLGITLTIRARYNKPNVLRK